MALAVAAIDSPSMRWLTSACSLVASPSVGHRDTCCTLSRHCAVCCCFYLYPSVTVMIQGSSYWLIT